MIKLIAFDVDGSLVNTKELHYESLNKAISEVAPEYVISLEDHLKDYNGKPTRVKLKMLNDKGLDKGLNNIIEQKKQAYTQQMISEIIKPEDYLLVKHCLVNLKEDGYKLAACSNAIFRSVVQMIHCSIGDNIFDWIYWNESVPNPKPSPQMYLNAMVQANMGPKETLIIEDSDVGLRAAYDSCAYVLPVRGPEDINYDNIKRHLELFNNV